MPDLFTSTLQSPPTHQELMHYENVTSTTTASGDQKAHTVNQRDVGKRHPTTRTWRSATYLLAVWSARLPSHPTTHATQQRHLPLPEPYTTRGVRTGEYHTLQQHTAHRHVQVTITRWWQPYHWHIALGPALGDHHPDNDGRAYVDNNSRRHGCSADHCRAANKRPPRTNAEDTPWWAAKSTWQQGPPTACVNAYAVV